MSGGDPLPAGLRGFDMPLGMDLEFPTLQMNTDPRDTISRLDSSIYLPFDGTMSMGLSPGDPLPQSFSSAPFPPSTAARLDRTEQPPFPNDTMARTPRTGSTPREGMSTATPQTEFTKRRNWPTTVVEELQDLLHILDANGRIKHVSPSAERLTGYTPAELRDQFMRNLLHPDDVGLFTSELNESMASGHPLRIFYRLKKKDGSYAVFEAVGHAHIAAARFAPNINNQTPFCQAVFMMARPYPTKNAALLDSFLEHKMENERLKRKIAELRKEEQEEPEEPEWAWQQRHEGPSDTSMARPGMTQPLQGLTDTPMPPRERREYPDSVAAESGGAAAGGTQQHPPTGPSRADTIEMLTGLRYQEGERSLGITTGNPSAALVTGDVGIAIAVDRDGRAGEKKKKVKVAEEYVCTDCGTLESPEWRKGPSGPKTLCNACGLRWAKKEKKKGAGPAGAAGP